VLLCSLHHAIFPCPKSCESTPSVPSYFFKLHFNIIVTSMVRCSKCFSTKTLYAYRFCPLNATNPAYVIVLLVILVIFGKWWKSQSSSIRIVSRSPILFRFNLQVFSLCCREASISLYSEKEHPVSADLLILQKQPYMHIYSVLRLVV
jgi:hypothetical protein